MSATWMETCPECVRLVRALDIAHPAARTGAGGAAVAGRESGYWVEARAHIMRAHPEMLGQGLAGCQKCDDHRAANAYQRDRTPYSIRAVLLSNWNKHRAAHLLGAPAEIYGRRAA